MANESCNLPVEAQELIKRFGLTEHVEGGYFARTFESSCSLDKEALPEGFGGNRHASTSIMFLLAQGQVSHLHQIESDEGWHHYAGDPLIVVECTPPNVAHEHSSNLSVRCTAVGHPLCAVEGLGTKSCKLASDSTDSFHCGNMVTCTPQYFVRSRRWFGAYLPSGSKWALVGCTVAPGFDFADFRLAHGAALQRDIMSALQPAVAAASGDSTAGGSGMPAAIFASCATARSMLDAQALIRQLLPAAPAATSEDT